MRALKSTFFGIVVAAISGAVYANPQDPNIVFDVVRAPGNDQVTLSRAASKTADALVTYAAYQATISNNSTNDLNRIFLRGTATTVGGTDNPVFDSSIPANACSAGSTTNSVTCSLPSIPPGGPADVVIVVFKAPKTGTQINFAWIAGGFEGNGVGNGCCSQSNTVSTALVDPATDPSFKTKVQSFVTPGGGKFLTGSEAITTSSDGWSTIVQVPPDFTSPTGSWTLATVNERSSLDPIPEGATALACPSYALSSTCFESRLAIPGSFASLAITIRLDSSFFKLRGTDPATLSLNYTGDIVPSPYLYVAYPHRLQLCSLDDSQLSLPSGTAPLPGRPCLSQPPFVYPNGYSIRDLRGDLEFRVLARDNGRYEQ